MFLGKVVFVFDFRSVDFLSEKFVDVLCKFGVFEFNFIVFLIMGLGIYVYLL